MKRTVAWALCLLMLITVFSGMSAFAAAPSATSIGKNTAKRHEVCTALSEAAKAYYPAGSTYSDLIALPGTKTDDSTEAIGSPLFNKLQGMMQPVDTISYSSLTSYWKYTDASEGSSDACLFYSDEISSSYNREHVWPKSRGNFYQSGAGSDIQHLRPTNATINSTRSNMTMGNVKNKTGWTVKTKDYNGKTVLWYISNYTDNDCQGLVEVADNVKGDVARIYLYVYTTYGAENANKNLFTKCGSYGASDNDGNKVIESLDTLLEWCALDPVDEWEMMRNDLCQKVQGNRNVFIDYPELGWYLFGRENEIPGDMPTPSGMAMGTTPSSYTITAVSNNEAWGTVALIGKIIEASPAEGYYAAGYTVLDGEATVSQNGNRFSVSPKSDCTVQINFAPKDICMITYNANGLCTDFSAYTGEEMTLRTDAPEVEGWRFIGWTETALSEQTTERPDYYEPGATYIPIKSVTLYALYTMIDDGSQGETDSYQLLTELPETVEGSYVLSSEDADYVLLCDGSETVSTTAAAIELSKTGMTLKDDALLDVTDQYTLICEQVTGDKYSFRLKGADTPLYLMTTDANGGFNVTDDVSNPEAQWTVSINSAGAVISNCAYTSRSIRFNSSSMMFRTYTSGQRPVYLWKSVTGGQVVYATSPVSTAHEHECALAEAQAPTCTEAGCIEHLYCSICSKCFSLEQYDETGELVEIPASEVVLPALGHDLVLTETIAPTCTTYGYSIYDCSRCDYYEFGDNVEALGHDWDEGVVTVEPTLESEGEITFTCRRCHATTTDTLPALEPVDPCADGHDWGEPEYVWAEDNSTVTATRVCKTNPEHVETESVETASEETLAPTVEAEGELVYTAAFTNPAFETQTKAVAIPKLEPTDPCAEGHDWAEPTYEWAEDNGSVTATRVCRTNAAHVETETVLTRAEITKEATYEEEGELVYTAEFTNPAFETQTRTVTIPKLEKPVEPVTDSPFNDVEPDAYYADPVDWAVEQGITNGTSATTFSPDKTCTRGQVVTFLWRAKGSPEPTITENPFTDVQENDYYYKAVLWAKETGVTTGTSADKFSPGMGCKRGQVVTFLWRAEGCPEPEKAAASLRRGGQRPPADKQGLPLQRNGETVAFTDVSPDAYYYNAVRWAVANGITNGTGATTFSPDKTCTRGQIVTFLYRDLAKDR